MTLLRVEGIYKSYGPTTVLREAEFKLDAGQCVALLGENGAGKSTLVKIISGITSPSRGRLLIDEQPVRFSGPRDAQRLGVAVIPQELATVPELTVGENLVLGRWPHWLGLCSHRRILRKAAEELGKVGIPLDVERPMHELTLAERQLVEIAKALSRSARLIILDEPTASLNNVESEKLLRLLQDFKLAKVALIYVSHHLDECFEIADQLIILRNGQIEGRSAPNATTRREVISAMTGAPYKEGIVPVEKGSEQHRRPLLRVQEWHTEEIPRLDGINFDLFAGEILGIFGLIGSGVETVARGLAGDRVHVKGSLEVNGRARRPFHRPVEARKAGITYVPAERKTEGLALGGSIVANLNVLILNRVARFGIVNGRHEEEAAAGLVGQFDIRHASLRQPVGELSGGNQQKVLLASRLAPEPLVLVQHEPTRGVDVGARQEIHRQMQDWVRRKGDVGIVLITSDASEAVAVCDRLLIMREGRIVSELSGAERSEPRALAAAAGKS